MIFRDEFISNDQMLMEAVCQEFKTKWGIPHNYIFIYSGDFAWVSVLSLRTNCFMVMSRVAQYWLMDFY